MYEITVFIVMGTIMLTYCLLNIFQMKKVERYARKNPKRFLSYHAIFIVIMMIGGTFLVSKYEDRLVTNAQEISTGYVYHIHQHSQPSFGLLGGGLPRDLNEFSLWGDGDRNTYKMTEWTLRDDGQTDTYILEDLKTKEQRTMRRLYDDERTYKSRDELLEYNNMIEKGGG